MNTKKTVIAASIAAVFAAPVAAFAKDQWEYHEDQWSNVVSYGNVPLAQDSSGSWGPWSEFIVPAAGGPVVNPVQFIGEGSGERYRPNPQTTEPPEPPAVVPPVIPPVVPPIVPPIVPPVVDVCGAGAWCGYAVYNNDSYYMWSGYPDGGEGNAKLALFLKPEDSAVTAGSGESYGTVELNLTHMNGEAPSQTTTKVLPAHFGYFNSEGMHDFNANVNGADSYEHTYYYYHPTGAEGMPHDYGGGDLPTDNDEVAVGWFAIQRYVSGDGGETYGYYVAGIQTPQTYLDQQKLNQIDNFKLGDVTGVGYFGNSVDAQGNGIGVQMAVSFRDGKWSGSWNEGRDSGVNTITSAGKQYVSGQVGFNASGNISGANIQSTNISALDGTIDAAKSSVNGTFFGKEAGSIGGTHHIVKTVVEGYSNATNVGAFLVNKGGRPE